MSILREIDKQGYRNLNHSFIPNQVWLTLSDAQRSTLQQLAVKYGGYTPEVIDSAKEMYEKNSAQKSFDKTGKGIKAAFKAKAKAHRRIARE